MRRIIFRGRNYGGIWLYGYLMPAEKPVINKDCKYRISVSPQACAGKDKMVYEVITDTIGQYTGLKDKNGKDIYEGDILRGDEYPFNCNGEENYLAVVVWADNVCGFYIITRKKPNSTVRGISHGNWNELEEEDIKSFEVIGNIHDNPELLEP